MRRAHGSDLLLGEPGGAQELGVLLAQDGIAVDAGACHQHQERGRRRHVLVGGKLHGSHGRHHAAFAVAHDADAAAVHLIDARKGDELVHRIAHEVIGGRRGEVAVGAADAAVVAAQHRDAPSRERIRQHGERAMAHDGFIAVLLAAARHQEDGGHGLLLGGGLRHQERSVQRVAGRMADPLDADVVRERRLRILRPRARLGGRERLAVVVRGELDRRLELALAVFARELAVRLAEDERGVALDGHVDRVRTVRGAGHAQRQVADALRRDVDGAGPAVGAVGRNDEAHHDRLRARLELPRPRARLLGAACLDGALEVKRHLDGRRRAGRQRGERAVGSLARARQVELHRAHHRADGAGQVTVLLRQVRHRVTERAERRERRLADELAVLGLHHEHEIHHALAGGGADPHALEGGAFRAGRAGGNAQQHRPHRRTGCEEGTRRLNALHDGFPQALVGAGTGTGLPSAHSDSRS